MTATPNHYELFGIPPTATLKEIKKAYRRLAIKYHPDHNPGNQQAEKKFKEINAAYEVLKDIRKRIQYDQAHIRRPPPNKPSRSAWTPPPSFADNFSMREVRHDTVNIAIVTALAAYGLILVFGSLLLNVKFLIVLALIAAFAAKLFGEEIGGYASNFVYDLASSRCNKIWILILILLFDRAFNTEFLNVFQQPASVFTGEFLFCIIRFICFVIWLFFYSPGHWLFLSTAFILIMLLYHNKYALTGWIFFAIQVFISTLFRYHPQALHDFVVFYQPLFTIQPLKPLI